MSFDHCEIINYNSLVYYIKCLLYTFLCLPYFSILAYVTFIVHICFCSQKIIYKRNANKTIIRHHFPSIRVENILQI